MRYANSGTGLMRWNMPLWYILMIFILLIMAYRVFNRHDNLQCNTLVLAVSAGVAIFFDAVIELPNLPFGMETAIYMFPFFTLGKIIGNIQEEHAQVKPMSKVGLATICILVGTIMTIGNGQVSYNADSYGKHGYAYFLAMSMLFFCVVSLLQHVFQKV